MLNLITHTNNRLLRAISLLTVAQTTRDGIHKFTFTSDDSEAAVVPLMTPKRIFLHIYLGSILLRLYYESVKSKEHKAYGLKKDHILNGIYALGRLDYFCHDYRKY